MHDVFISYSSKETEAAEAVRTVLKKNKITCWMAPDDIPPGSNYAKEIPVAIRECTVFLVMVSELSQRSQWVPKELDAAVSCGKTIIPFMIENCPLNDEFNFLLTGSQRYTAYREKANAMESLVKRIHTLTTKSPGPEPPEVEMATPDFDCPIEQELIVENTSTDSIRCPKCGSDQVVKTGLAKKIGVGIAAGVGASMLMTPLLAPLIVPVGAAIAVVEAATATVAGVSAATVSKYRYRCQVCHLEFLSVQSNNPAQADEAVAEETDKK